MTRDEIDQLEAWIEGSLRFRRRLRVVAAVAAVVAVALWLVSATVGTVALLIVGSIYGIGWWITFGHISDWRARIELLEQRRRAERAGRADPSPRKVD